jgi:phosphohistidine phosphatase
MASVIELLLVRHAIAAERGPKYPDDRLRPLTAEGARRFREAVRGLDALGVACDLILTSPLVRAEETATLLSAGLRGHPPVQVLAALAQGGAASDVIAAIGRNARKHARLALVGHEPDLGELAARLLGAHGQIEFRKGAVCAIDVTSVAPGGPGTLRWLLPPRTLRRLAP